MLQSHFMDEYFQNFENTEEKRLTHRLLTNACLWEKSSNPRHHEDDVARDTLNALLTLTEFQVLEAMLLDDRGEEGQGRDIGSGSGVTLLCESSPMPASQKSLCPRLPPAGSGILANMADPRGYEKFRLLVTAECDGLCLQHFININC